MESRVFDAIYEANGWNGTDTRSGPGSGHIPTTWVAAMLATIARDPTFRVASVLDVGCGEALWQPELPGYVGVDVAIAAIEEAHANHQDWDFRTLDDVPDDARFDLVFCRDTMQHLSVGHGLDLLDYCQLHADRWLLLSTYRPGLNEVDIPDGYTYRPDLTMAPFDLGPPLVWIADGFAWDVPEVQPTRDPTKFMGLWLVTP